MITIEIPGNEFYREETEEFISTKPVKLQLEHSLISLRKWESKWHKPFLNQKDHTDEESIDYVRCMTLTQNVDPNVYYKLPLEEVQRIMDYIRDPMTATWFSEEPGKKGGTKKIITAEVIYYWMIELGVPIELEKWHLNQLLTLIRVISAEREPKKKMSQRQLLSRNKALNKARRATHNTRG